MLVSCLEFDLNESPSSHDQNSSPSSTFTGMIMVYDENAGRNSSPQDAILNSFRKLVNSDASLQYRKSFKDCLESKANFDQLFHNILKSIKKSFVLTQDLALHFLIFAYDLGTRTFYLYSAGMFDLFLYNGKVSGGPIAPLQNYSNHINLKDLDTEEISISQKTFHLVFENGLSSDGYFIYCGVPLAKDHPIHATALLSRIFYRLKRDPSKDCQLKMEERLKKTFPKHLESDIINAFYYLCGSIPIL